MFDTYSDIFSRRAHLYQQAMTNYPDARDAEFGAMLEPLGETGRSSSICDVPSGGGYLAAYLPTASSYVAVEPTTQFASLFVPGDRQEIVVAEPREMPFDSGRFDTVISLAGLHHEPDKRLVLDEICRIVKSGGTIVIADVAAGSQEDTFLNGFVDANSEMGHDGRFLDDAFADDVRGSGMSIVSDEYVSMPWRFASSADAARFATDLFGMNAPLAEVEEGLREIVGLRERDGAVEIGWHLRRFVCQKTAGENR